MTPWDQPSLFEVDEPKTTRYGFAIQGEPEHTLQTPKIRAILDLNFSMTKKSVFPNTHTFATYSHDVPTSSFSWYADIPNEDILETPRTPRETLAIEFEEANPGVEYPFYWVGDELFHKEDQPHG